MDGWGLFPHLAKERACSTPASNQSVGVEDSGQPGSG